MSPSIKNPLIYTLITGSSSGIGKELAIYCSSLGRNVLLVALPGSGLREVHHDIKKKYGVESDFLEVDLSGQDGPLQVFNWVSGKHYEVDFLINNAGIAGTSVFESSSLQYNDDRIMVNIRALVLLTRLFIPILKKHSKAYILNLGSLSAFYSIPYKSLYAASKAFVVNFSRSLRSELRNTGISVSVVCPNGVRTNEGTNARIEAHGLKGKLTTISSLEVSKMSVDYTLKGRFLIIPGGINKVLFIIGKVTPEWIQQKILINEFRREVKVTKIE
jgi:uncharacterized protein